MRSSTTKRPKITQAVPESYSPGKHIFLQSKNKARGKRRRAMVEEDTNKTEKVLFAEVVAFF